MIIVTNRNYQKNAPAEEVFGPDFNVDGPDELRLATARRTRGGWKVDLLPDEIEYEGTKMPASRAEFLGLQARMKKSKKDCLFFVHGFNNDFASVLERGRLFEKNFGVETICFTWPANGRAGTFGAIGGVASYKSDKRDAVRSAVALDRVFEKLGAYFTSIPETESCGQRVSLLLHSMGNYLFKHLMKSSVYHGETALFDNVILAAADVNNRDHAGWLDAVSYRRRLYVTINENDSALMASRLKFGAKQEARLGHFTQNLDSTNAIYFDFTDAKHVDSAHAYFEGEAIAKNAKVKAIFRSMVRGQPAERGLDYDVHTRTYRIP